MYLERKQDLISCFEARESGWIIQSKFARPYHYLGGILIFFHLSFMTRIRKSTFFKFDHLLWWLAEDNIIKQQCQKNLISLFYNYNYSKHHTGYFHSYLSDFPERPCHTQYACSTNVSYRFQSLLPATIKALLSEKSGISFKLNRANVSTLYCQDAPRDRKKSGCKWVSDPYQCTKIESQLVNCLLPINFILFRYF